jgi:Zn-finger nucleic acid-binding protein
MTDVGNFRNEPKPEFCPGCSSDLKSSTGYVGEEVLYCPKCGIVWEDSEDAIRRVR